MSRAVVFDRYGPPEVLHVIDVDVPVPDPAQLLVAVEAAGVQPVDLLMRSGAAQAWMPARFPQRLGNEFAGTVQAVGPGVTGVGVGAAVIGWAVLACYADHVVVNATDVVPDTAGLAWTEAGALSASGQTASSALAELGVGAGETLLVHGGSGGVGSMVVQLAVADGARVIATASERNLDFVRGLGAVAVAYGDGVVGRVRAVAPDGVGAVIDTSGSVPALRASLDLGVPAARVGTVAAVPGVAELGVRRLSTQRSTTRLADLVERCRSGTLRVHVDRAFPFAEAAAAHRTLERGGVRGKLVLMPH